MIDILEFVFRNFWTWLGTLILVGTIAEGIGGFVRVTVKKISEGKADND